MKARALLSKLKRPFCPMMRLFLNPHHLSGVIFASFLTNSVTIFWSLIVLSKSDTLSNSGSRYAWVTEYIHENVLASILLMVASASMYGLWTHRRPSALTNVYAGILSAWWTFVFVWNFISPGPIYSTATSLSAGIAFAAFYAFLDGHVDETSDANA